MLASCTCSDAFLAFGLNDIGAPSINLTGPESFSAFRKTLIAQFVRLAIDTGSICFVSFMEPIFVQLEMPSRMHLSINLTRLDRNQDRTAYIGRVTSTHVKFFEQNLPPAHSKCDGRMGAIGSSLRLCHQHCLPFALVLHTGRHAPTSGRT